MAKAIDSCESTGSTSNKRSRLVIAVKELHDPSPGVTSEASGSLFDLFNENGLGMTVSHDCWIASALSVQLQGDVPDGFEDDLTNKLDLMFAGTGSVRFLPLILPPDDEESMLDETKGVKVEDFMRVIDDTLGMMAGVEIDEDNS